MKFLDIDLDNDRKISFDEAEAFILSRSSRYFDGHGILHFFRTLYSYRTYFKQIVFQTFVFRKFNTAKAQPAWFMSMDTDDDGFISPWEFDGSSQLTGDVLNWIEMKRSRS